MGSFKTELTKKMRMNFSEEEKKQVLECLDLERNAAILDKTDKAIADKLRAKNASLLLTVITENEKFLKI